MAQGNLLNLQPRVEIPGWLAALVVFTVWAGRKIGRLARIACCSPAPWILAALLVASLTAISAAAWAVFVIAGWAACVLTFWRMSWPQGFRTHVAGRLRGTARSLLVYRYRWSRGLKRSGVISGTGGYPLLVRTTSTGVYDRLRVRMVAGQRVEDFAEEADRLRQTFNALACRVNAVPNRPHWLDLTFLTKDPLLKTVRPYPPQGRMVSRVIGGEELRFPEPDWQSGLPIARREDGKPWRLRLVGSHTLLVGATGAGKSGVLWAIIDQLIPAIDDRTARLWVLDPKGGMELSAGKEWFDRFAYGSQPGEFVGILEDAVRVMHRRQATLRGKTRLHQPSADEPLITIVIDELASLTSWTIDGEAQQRIKAALNMLLRQGRAVGVVVVGAIQDPRKETLPSRDLFPTRIALRLVDSQQVDMSLGQGAWKRGAKCEEIPDTLQGVGYVVIEGEAAHHRVRFAHVTDDMIRGRQLVEAA
jgi:DNA segregation ATPase FtsK/SpoIIIE, S-DNA-T family